MLRVKRIDYECLEDRRVPKFMISLEEVEDTDHWYVKKVFTYEDEKWIPLKKYSHNNGMGLHVGVVKYSIPEVSEYFKMLVKIEGYGYDK